jgi:hypothetical protein
MHASLVRDYERPAGLAYKAETGIRYNKIISSKTTTTHAKGWLRN